MTWAIIGYSNSNTQGLPFSVIADGFGSEASAIQEAYDERLQQLSDGTLRYVEYESNGVSLSKVLAKLNEPFVAKYSAQSQFPDSYANAIPITGVPSSGLPVSVLTTDERFTSLPYYPEEIINKIQQNTTENIETGKPDNNLMMVALAVGVLFLLFMAKSKK